MDEQSETGEKEGAPEDQKQWVEGIDRNSQNSALENANKYALETPTRVWSVQHNSLQKEREYWIERQEILKTIQNYLKYTRAERREKYSQR